MGKRLRDMKEKVTAVGLEPTAIALKVRCSTTELRGHTLEHLHSLFDNGMLSAQLEYSRLVKPCALGSFEKRSCDR
jgi:hypothetical protein